ncbi:MAG: DNA-protecting protein DprA [Alphaproteobacteria bacterium]|nr:DNA-protecting protein DprA [Alphaproteobacteria bacterium]
MINQNQFNLLRLIRSDNIGVVTLNKLLEKYSTAENIIKNIKLINKPLKRKISLISEKEVQKELKLLENLGGELLFQDDDRYPEKLKQINDAPLVLSCLGDISLLQQTQVGIVGSRAVSTMGKKVTRKLAGTLVKKGYVITSGMARGVDGLAHQGSLDENGKTIAVLGSSVDFIYPAENKEIYQSILDNGGLIISENRTGSGIVSKHQFPKRNRIIAALSEGVVITECGKRSGSLITARLALEMGKELFVIPGHPLDKHFEGSNELLKQSCAYITTNADDILEQLELPKEFKPLKSKEEIKQIDLFQIKEEKLEDEFIMSSKDKLTEDLEVIDVILDIPQTIDEIIRLTGLGESEVASQITMLELEGKINRVAGGAVIAV